MGDLLGLQQQRRRMRRPRVLARFDGAWARWVVRIAVVLPLVLVAGAAARAQSASPISVQVDEGQPSSGYSVRSAFNPGSCSLATPGPDVTLNGGSSVSLPGGTLSAASVGANVTYSSNTGLYFGSTAISLAFEYQCARGGAVQTTSPATLTLVVPQFSPGTTSIVANENGSGTTIGPGTLAPGRNYDNVIISSPPSLGTVSVGSGPNPSITYTPNPNAFGQDKFSYTLVQTVLGTTYHSVPGTVAVSVRQLAPVASNDSATTNENTPVTIPVTANDINGPFSSVAVASSPLHGTASASGLNITYTPATGYSGPDSFTYTVSNSVGHSAPATVTLAVAPLPVANPDTASTNANQPVTINVTANDSNGPFTSVAVASAPGHGTATVSGLNIVYTPATNFFGNDSFTYTVSNAVGRSAPAPVSLSVQALAVPTSPGVSTSTPAGKPVTIDATAGASNGPFTAVAIVSGPSHGSVVVTGLSIVYTPQTGFSGTDTFSYTLSNLFGPSKPIPATVQVQPQPMAQALTVSTSSTAPVTVDLTQGATGGPFSRATIVQAPPSAAGTATIQGLSLVFSPVPGFSGTVTVSYTLSNAFATSAPAMVTIIVAARPDPSLDPTVSALLNSQLETVRRIYHEQLSNFERRLEELHRQAHGFSFRGLTFSTGAPQQQPGPPGAPGAPEGTPATPPASATPPTGGGASADSDDIEMPDRFGAFVNGTVNFGQRNGTSYRNGFDFAIEGVSAGADYRLTSWSVLGIGGGYSGGRDHLDNLGSRSDVDSFNVTLYGTAQPTDEIYIDGVFTYGSLDFDTRRLAPLTALFAVGKRSGDQLYGAITAGYEFSRGELSLAPYARLNVASARLDRFIESGAGFASLNFGPETLNDVSTTIGVRGDYAYSMENGILSPHFRLEYDHEFEDTSAASLLYADQPFALGYRFTADRPDRNYFTVAVGANFLTEDALSIFLDYEALLGYRGEESQTVTFGISRRF